MKFGLFFVGVIIGVFLGFLEQIKSLKLRVTTVFVNIEKVFNFLGKIITGAEKTFELIKSPFIALKDSAIAVFRLWENSIYTIGAKMEKFLAFILRTIGKIFPFFETLAKVVETRGFGPIYLFVEIFTQFGQLLAKLEKFLTTLPVIGGFLEAGITLGKGIGKLALKALAFLEIIYGLYQSFSDPKLTNKSTLQKIITGVVKGILNLFDIFQIIGLNLIEFTEVRDRIDKIFTSFNQNLFKGIADIFNQIISGIIGIGAKIVGWISKLFSKDAGDAITKWGREFDLGRSILSIMSSLGGKTKDTITKDIIPNAWEIIKKAFSSSILGFGFTISKLIFDIFSWLGKMMSWDNIKKFVKTSMGISQQEETPLKAKPVADFIDDNNRTLISRGQAFSFDKQDQIMAFKSGGPIDNILQGRDEHTGDSIKQLTVTVQELNKGLQQYFKTAAALQSNEIKIMGENVNLLKDIRDKKASSNVVVQNTANNTSFGDRPSSNLDYRRELTDRVTF